MVRGGKAGKCGLTEYDDGPEKGNDEPTVVRYGGLAGYDGGPDKGNGGGPDKGNGELTLRYGSPLEYDGGYDGPAECSGGGVDKGNDESKLRHDGAQLEYDGAAGTE